MTKKRKPYKTYTREFKLEAVRMMSATDRSTSEIAMELGINETSSTNGKSSLRGRVMSLQQRKADLKKKTKVKRQS